MLRQSVGLSADLRSDGDGVKATVRIWVEDVGHRVPTGFVDRHLLLVVEAFDEDGRSLPASAGPTLPVPAGPAHAGKEGRLFAKLLTDRDGRAPVPFWLAANVSADTRLTPGKVEDNRWAFPANTDRVRVRIIYRRFWDATARIKGWPDGDLVIQERTLRLR
jgi:hypothetical protein